MNNIYKIKLLTTKITFTSLTKFYFTNAIISYKYVKGVHSNGETVFSKILSGEIPSFKVYEDDFVYAF